MPRPTHIVCSLAVTTSLLLSACGSGDAPSSSATTVGPTTTATPDTTPTTTAATLPRRGGMPGGGSVTAPTPTHADLAYADGSASQVLDIWLPEGAAAATPLVIYIHGGAFKGGDKAMVGSKVQPLLDAGFAVASLNYRLSGEAAFPAGAQDVKAAVRWLRSQAGTYNIDPTRFATWGESAGGHLASLIGTSGSQDTVLDDDALGNAGVSSEVQAVVDWYGPSDFLQMDEQAAAGGGCTAPEAHDPASSPESTWMGAAIQTVPATVARANPITYIAGATDLPAFSIAHGDADCNVPFQQSEILAKALSDAGGQPELTILPGASHGDAQFDTTLLAPTIAWLETVLGG
jgi:acetyl esterase/lipase